MVKDKTAREAVILGLFDGFPSSQTNITEGNLGAYVEATASVSLEALQRSMQQFVSGKVERNNAFVPSAPEFAENARAWEGALAKRASQSVELHTGLLNMDWGRGSIDMRGLTEAEQDAVIATKGVTADGRSMSGLPIEAIREALGGVQIEQSKRVVAPKLSRMT